MNSRLVMTAGWALILFAALGVHEARAVLGGVLILPQQAGPAQGEEISLTAFSWTPSQQEMNPERSFSERTPPKSGAGTMVISKPVAANTPRLSRACGSKEGFSTVVLRLPNWDERAPDGGPILQTYTLSNVTVTKCAHQEGAPGEAFWLSFTDVRTDEIPAQTGQSHTN